MKPLTNAQPNGNYNLSDPEKGMIIYQESGNNESTINLTGLKGNFILTKIDPKTGGLLGKEERLKGGIVVKINASLISPVVLWITKK